ncbi:MAG: NADH-quinone oxidoreductase subunit NuoF, partial [Candidatus Delongbacteria bacterium]|nr:NADH-quinone oxidoreductase subunit NuoF [Candidatus Delongbacteria bacterium]
KWGFIPKGTEKPIYLICNADEGEPGTFKDRQIMEYDPHLLIEGMIISARAIGSKLGFIYIRGEFDWIADILDKAVEEAKADGQLNDFDIIVHRGAGAYVCGEETALIESVEGKRGEPRIKPPFPAVEGLYGCPTIVNNVETIASVPFIIEKGADAFKGFGYENNTGFKLFGISGNVNKPGVYEYPMGVPFNKLIEAAGGVKGNLKAAIVGGLSVQILKPEELATLNMDYDSCIKHGTGLGSGGIMVINDEFSIPELAYRTIKFYAHESCGRCAPCRHGSDSLRMLLKKLVVCGEGTMQDIDTIVNICSTVPGTTICPTGEAFSVPIKAMVEKFRDEFEALVK